MELEHGNRPFIGSRKFEDDFIHPAYSELSAPEQHTTDPLVSRDCNLSIRLAE